MIHDTCNRCQMRMESESLRYVVEIKMYIEFDEMSLEPRDEDRQIEQMQELLSAPCELNTEFDIDVIGEAKVDNRCRSLRFDLCSGCHQEFKANPLGARIAPKVSFSQN